MDARRQGADHHRAADVPLSRPCNVRPGALSHPRGGAGRARAPRPDQPFRARPRGDGRQGRGAQGDRQGNQGHRRRCCEVRRRSAGAAPGRALHRRPGGELLMGIELKMPALSPTMEEGTLAKWLVKEGDEVKSGDILAEIETDKATMEFEAVDEGKIAKILVPEGSEGVKVGAPIAILAGEGEDSGPSPREAAGEGQRSGAEQGEGPTGSSPPSPQPLSHPEGGEGQKVP